MRQAVGKSKRMGAWMALALVCLVAEAAGFVALHQSMQDYRASASIGTVQGYR